MVNGFQPRIGLPEVGIIFATVIVHLVYFLLLQRGYRVGDLSLVYPLARGTGPGDWLTSRSHPGEQNRHPSPKKRIDIGICCCYECLFGFASQGSRLQDTKL